MIASNFLEHYEGPVLDALISELQRVLKPGGRLALVRPNFQLQPRKYDTHRAIFTDGSVADWLSASGFRVIRMLPRFLLPLYLRLPWRPLAGQMFAVAERPAS